MRTISTISVLWFSLAVLLNQPELHSQELRTCESVAADPDGDGYGWQFLDNMWDSCIVTDETEPAPVIINPQTGVAVDLQRAYWNPNKDIANRQIQCNFFMFDRETQSFIERTLSSGPPQFSPLDYHRSFHLPLVAGTSARKRCFPR